MRIPMTNFIQRRVSVSKFGIPLRCMKKIWHIGLVSSWLSSSVKSMMILAAPCPEIRNPNSLSLSIEQLHFCGHFFTTFLLGCSSTRRCANEHLSPNLHPAHRFVPRTFWGMPLFTRRIRASTFQMVPAWHAIESPRRASASRTFRFYWMFHKLWFRMFWRRSGLSPRFGTLICIVPEAAIVSFRTLPYGFPLPTITLSPKNMTLFPLILDQHVWFNSPVSGFKIPRPQILLHTPFGNFLQSVIIRFRFLQVNLVNCTILIRSSISQTLLFLICRDFLEYHQVGIAP